MSKLTEDNRPSTPDKKPAAEKPTDETVKETLEAIVIAFILAFVFRAYIVEAFVIPTGSMAPTLLGEHADITCDQCGYRWMTDIDATDRTEQVPVRGPSGLTQYQTVLRNYVTNQSLHAACPMCHFSNPLYKVSIAAGDRILVHKFIYSIPGLEPRRWDVVVFKCPFDPPTNYIKRLVGLPGESLWVIDGNLYVKPKRGEWQIARKTDRPKIQRDVWQPIYHSDFVPIDKGQGSSRGANNLWQTPWVADKSGDWDIDALRSYSHKTSDADTIRFDFEQRASPGSGGWYAYNLMRNAPGEAIEDVRIAAVFLPSGPGLSVKLQTTSRLDGMTPSNPGNDASPRTPTYTLTASIDAAGKTAITAMDNTTGEMRELASGVTTPFAAGQPRLVELWYVDQQASLWVDGDRVLKHNFDLPNIEAAKLRDPPPLYPQIAVEVAGSPVVLHHVELDRDIYYSSDIVKQGGFHSGQPGTGVLIKSGQRRNGAPVNLENDQFFCMGDNSPMSHDSRYWNTINPWIEKRMFEEDDHTQRIGIVPRKLMMGRAFFVYFPAPYVLQPGMPQIIPNFGDMRFIH